MDSPELRQLLTDTWSRSAAEAVARGVPQRAVAETLLQAGLALLLAAAGLQESEALLTSLAGTIRYKGRAE